MSIQENVTLLLDQAVSGDRDAANELFSIVYQELHQLAQMHMKREADGVTIQSTVLVHEVWLRLIGNQEQPNWKNRGHFFASAATAMKRILVDAARHRKRQKRGGGRLKFAIQEGDKVIEADDELIALGDALELLRAEDEQKAVLVELRFFAGFTNKEVAEQLGISTATAERYWTFARAWLRSKMEA